MAKLAFVLCALLALAYAEVGNEEIKTVEEFAEKLDKLKEKTAQDIAIARKRITYALTLLRERVVQVSRGGRDAIEDVLKQVVDRFDIMKSQLGKQNVSECEIYVESLQESAAVRLSQLEKCVDGKLNEGYKYLKDVDPYEAQAQSAIRSLESELEWCKTQESSRCLSSVTHRYLSFLHINLSDILRYIRYQEQLVLSTIRTVSGCAPHQFTSQLIQSSGPALVQFRQCIQHY